MGYVPNHRESVLEFATLHRIPRPLTKTGWLTAEALEAGLSEVVHEATLSFRPGPRSGEPFVALGATDDGRYEVITGRPGDTISVRVDRLNRARQIFHAFAHAFVTGDPQDEANAFALFEQHQTEGVPA